MELLEFPDLSLTTWLAVAVTGLILWLSIRRPSSLPPGPRIIFPLLGHLPLLRGDITEVLLRMWQKYGDIYHLYFGSCLVIVLNGYDVLKEALVNRGDVFSDRPSLIAYELISSNGGIILTSGETWKKQRKFLLGSLKELGLGKNLLQGKVMVEVASFLGAIEQVQGQPFDIKSLSKVATFNVISNMALGKRFDYNDPGMLRCLELIDIINQRAESTGIVNFIPGLKYLPFDLFNAKELKACRDEIDLLLAKPLIAERLRQNEDHYGQNDLIDMYIKESRTQDADNMTSINDEPLVNLVFDLFAAGSETTSAAICWALVFMLVNPEIQKRIHAEIRDTIGQRSPRMEDKPDLPYVEAFIMEVLRIGDIVPLSLSHATSREIIFRGYKIPKGAMVIPSLHSALRDPSVWENPNLFRPERFLLDGKLLRKDQLLPFSLGRRVCLGESLAKMSIFLFLVSMIQRFQFFPAEGSLPSQTDFTVGVIHAPKPFRMKAVGRW